MPFKAKNNKEAGANQPPLNTPDATKPPVEQDEKATKPTVNENKVIDVRTATPPVKLPVESVDEAMKLFKKTYQLPKGDEIAYVTQDGNVFYAANESSARAHAKQKGIKLYTVKP